MRLVFCQAFHDNLLISICLGSDGGLGKKREFVCAVELAAPLIRKPA